MSNTNTSKARKAVAAARLAASAATREDGDGECAAAAGTAGRPAWEAGTSLADLSAAVPQLMQAACATAWSLLVDAWYDADEASRATEAEMQDLCQALAGTERGCVAAAMYAEILRCRAARG